MGLTAFCYVSLIVLICALIFLNLNQIRLLSTTQRNKKLPAKGKATMFDVRHLLMEGEKELATQLYCEIFNVPLSKARKDVEELQRSLKV